MTSNNIGPSFDSESQIAEFFDRTRDCKDLECLGGRILKPDVFIAGTGVVGATYARIILDANPDAKVVMADIGSQESPIIGAHLKNSIKYQKDIDSFVNVIKAALQPISLTPQDTIPTLRGTGWTPLATSNDDLQGLISHGSNPLQVREKNLISSAVTRTVGGMCTHWTCACPKPHADERRENPIDWEEFRGLLYTARKKLLKVNTDQFDKSVRQIVVRKALKEHIDSSRVKNLPLAVERRQDDPRYVTWSGADTVLGDAVKRDNFVFLPEHRVTRVLDLVENKENTKNTTIDAVLLRDLKGDQDKLVFPKVVVLCCGAVPNLQVLYNSGITEQKIGAFGHYLCEQSIAFCQIVLKKQYIEKIPTSAPWNEFTEVAPEIEKHTKNHPEDPLPIPLQDPEPQLMLPYSSKYPWHVQIHRNAFSYGDVGPRADPRVVVDLRWFGAQRSEFENCVTFAEKKEKDRWTPGTTDIYGMPQPTFVVKRSKEDEENDQRMMKDMTDVANCLGSYLPGSTPQFMEPGLAFHITGVHRVGNDDQTSVADKFSRIHGYTNLYIGGNGCIPDATACSPTSISVAIAIKGARAILRQLWPNLNAIVKLKEDEADEVAAGRAEEKEEEEAAKREEE